MFRPTALRSTLFLATALAAGGASAHDLSCHVGSDYSISLDADALRFERSDGSPARIELRAGRLYVDGAPARLSDEDAERIARMLRELRALAPEVQAIALDALDIAFDALSEVAEGLLEDAGDSQARLAEAHARIEAQLRAAPIGSLDDRQLDRVIEQSVADVVPDLVADVVRSALAAAFTGDTARVEALEARAEQIEKDIERRIEPRAEALGKRAQDVCDRIAGVDGIESELDYRLPDGSRLDLLRTDPH